MNNFAADVLLNLARQGYSSQRKLAALTGQSLGRINNGLKSLQQEGYIKPDYQLTSLAWDYLAARRPQNAIILAAGYGLRMAPINTQMPKGLLQVKGVALVERIISFLHEAGISEIDLVVGHLKEMYDYLVDQDQVRLVYNPDYALKNNLHSLQLLSGKIANTYIIPCDIWLAENPFSEYELYSWYAVSSQLDPASAVRLARSRQLLPHLDNSPAPRMIGIAYLDQPAGQILQGRLDQASQDKLYNNAFWEDVLFDRSGQPLVYGRILSPEQAVEINTYEELRELDSDSASLHSWLIDLAAEQLLARPAEIRDIAILKKGMTNRSFSFRCRQEKYIMRIPGEGTEQLINRANEYKVYQVLKGEQIAEEVVFMAADSGLKISRYLPDARVCDPNNRTDVKRCMAFLRSFHEKKLLVEHEFDLYERINFYESLWQGQPSIFADYQTSKANVFSLARLLEGLPRSCCLTHIDAVPDNFLLQNDKIYLIDWEYAALQDPHLDLAMFIVYAMYDREQAEFLIDSYFPEGCPAKIRLKIYCYIATAGLLWSNWCEYKRLCGVEFGEYSLRQYRFAKDYYKIATDYQPD